MPRLYTALSKSGLPLAAALNLAAAAAASAARSREPAASNDDSSCRTKPKLFNACGLLLLLEEAA